jgi:hypothetical protein
MQVGVVQIAEDTVSVVSIVFGIIGMSMGFYTGLSQAITRKDVLVACPYAGHDRQLYGDDRVFRC